MRFKHLAEVSAVALLAGLSPAFAQTSLTVSNQITVVPNSSAYVSGYCLGGVQTVYGMVRPSGTGGTILTSISIADTKGQNAAMDILIFKAAPTGTYTDHSTCSVTAGDLVNLVGVVSSTSFACILASASTAGLCQSLTPIEVNNGSQTSTAIWALPIVRSTPTYATASLYFNYQGLPD